MAKGTLEDEQRREDDWLAERDEQRRGQGEASRGWAVDTSAAALGGGGGMMSEDMARCVEDL